MDSVSWLIRSTRLPTPSIAGVKTGLLGSAAIVEVVADRIEPACCRHRSSTRCSSMAAVTALSARRSSRPIASAFFQRRWRSPRTSARHRCSPDAAGERCRRRHGRSPTRRPWRLQCGRHRRIQRGARAVDVVVRADGTIDHLESPWIDTVHVRGSGCTFAAATAAALARGEDAVERSVRRRRSSRIGCGPRSGSISVGPARLPTGSPGEWSGARRVGGRASVDVLPFLAIVKAELRAGLDVDQREELGTIELHVW